MFEGDEEGLIMAQHAEQPGMLLQERLGLQKMQHGLMPPGRGGTIGTTPHPSRASAAATVLCRLSLINSLHTWYIPILCKNNIPGTFILVLYSIWIISLLK